MPSDLTAPARVNYDDLEFDDDLALLDGEPFTGTVFSLHVDGSPESEGQYVDGLPEGVQQEWFRSGQPARRWIAVRGAGASESWAWHENGQLRSYRRDVDQRPVELKAWNEAGEEVDPKAAA